MIQPTIISSDHGLHESFEAFGEYLKKCSPKKAISHLNGSEWSVEAVDQVGALGRRGEPVFRIFSDKQAPLSKGYWKAGADNKIRFVIMKKSGHQSKYCAFLVNNVLAFIKRSGLSPYVQLNRKSEQLNQKSEQQIISQNKSRFHIKHKTILPDAEFTHLTADDFHQRLNLLAQGKQTQTKLAYINTNRSNESRSHSELCIKALNYHNSILSLLNIRLNCIADDDYRIPTGDKIDVLYTLGHGKRYVILEAEPFKENNDRRNAKSFKIGLWQLSKYKALISSWQYSETYSDQVQTVLIIPKSKLDKGVYALACKLGHSIIMWDFDADRPLLLT